MSVRYRHGVGRAPKRPRMPAPMTNRTIPSGQVTLVAMLSPFRSKRDCQHRARRQVGEPASNAPQLQNSRRAAAMIADRQNVRLGGAYLAQNFGYNLAAPHPKPVALLVQ